MQVFLYNLILKVKLADSQDTWIFESWTGFAEIKISRKSYLSFAYRMLTAKQEWPMDGHKHPS